MAVLFESNGLKVKEKENKKDIVLSFAYDKNIGKIKLDLDVNSHQDIQLLMEFEGEMVKAGVFGYSKKEIKDKNIDFDRFQIKKSKNKVKIIIPKKNKE